MRSILSIPIQKFFIVTVILKVGSSGIGWAIGDPWGFGFVLPLAFMAIYIAIGLKRQDKDVSDEKFADTCYYLGFIFTVTSIIFSLFDLPSIGTKMSAIAVRFGAAMVSTVFGLVVRVYLVSFRQNVEDAVRDAETSVIEANQRLREHLSIAVEKLVEFETKVNEATSSSIAKVSVGVEDLTKSYGEKLTNFFLQQTAENKQAFDKALGEVRKASLRLAQSVDEYSVAMKGNLESIEGKVTYFADAITKRLEQTTFPDDYFVKKLEEPLSRLGEGASNIASQVESASGEVVQALESMRTSIAALRSRASDMEGVLDSVASLASTQEALMVGSQAQVDSLGVLTSTLRAIQEGLGALSNRVLSQTDVLTHYSDLSKEQITSLDGVTLALRALGDISGTVNKHTEGLVQITEHLARATDTAQLAKDELPLVKQSVHRMSNDLSILAVDMRAFAQDVAGLAEKLSGIEVRVQVIQPPGLRLVTDHPDSEPVIKASAWLEEVQPNISRVGSKTSDN